MMSTSSAAYRAGACTGQWPQVTTSFQPDALSHTKARRRSKASGSSRKMQELLVPKTLKSIRFSQRSHVWTHPQVEHVTVNGLPSERMVTRT
jgi:hypothetical protein